MSIESACTAPHRNTIEAHKHRAYGRSRGTIEAGVRTWVHGWKALWQGSTEGPILSLLSLSHVGIRFSIAQPYLSRAGPGFDAQRKREVGSAPPFIYLCGRCSSSICGGAFLYILRPGQRSNARWKGRRAIDFRDCFSLQQEEAAPYLRAAEIDDRLIARCVARRVGRRPRLERHWRRRKDENPCMILLLLVSTYCIYNKKTDRRSVSTSTHA
jgi:hypothetical protein